MLGEHNTNWILEREKMLEEPFQGNAGGGGGHQPENACQKVVNETQQKKEQKSETVMVIKSLHFEQWA